MSEVKIKQRIYDWFICFNMSLSVFTDFLFRLSGILFPIFGITIIRYAQLTVTDALDTMVKWFCILFNNQFTPDEVYDNYPADRLMHDIALALMATQTETTEVLDTFPTIPAVQEAEQILAEAENPEVTIPQEA